MGGWDGMDGFSSSVTAVDLTVATATQATTAPVWAGMLGKGLGVRRTSWTGTINLSRLVVRSSKTRHQRELRIFLGRSQREKSK